MSVSVLREAKVMCVSDSRGVVVKKLEVTLSSPDYQTARVVLC